MGGRGGEKTAIKGTWVKGPGEKFFRVLMRYISCLEFIAEGYGLHHCRC